MANPNLKLVGESAPRTEPGAKGWALRGGLGAAARHFPLRPGRNRIGYQSVLEVPLTEEGVSRLHAVLIVGDDELCIEDLASKNGTFVNGRRITRQGLEEGDEIALANVTLRLEAVDAADTDLAISWRDRDGANGGDSQTETPILDARPATTRVDSSSRAAEACKRLDFGDFVPGVAPAMLTVYQQLAAIARSDLPALLVGETGVGKEGIAAILHRSSSRRDGPLVAINCAAIPGELLEAELFGIGAGVATGVTARPGLFRQAHGGTLLLDEIGDMPPALQAKLLRALQESSIQPVGGAPVTTNVRVIAATHMDVEAAITSGSFRRDLYYRLAGAVIRIPPLRERPEDIPALVEHFAQQALSESGKHVRGFTIGALQRLTGWSWPGNVRELQHVVQQLIWSAPERASIDSTAVEQAPRMSPSAQVQLEAGETRQTPRESAIASNGPATTLSLGALERAAIEEALRRTAGNKSKAAHLLGISREALRRKIKKHDIEIS